MSSTVAARPISWHHQIMSSIAGTNKKRGRGRPVVNSTAINLRAPPALLAPLDSWIADQPEPKPSRPEAIRYALMNWLTSQGYRRRDEDTEGQIDG